MHPDARRRYLEPRTLIAIRSLELRARMVVEGLMIGLHKSPYRGFSTEFAEHRQYVAGDDIRHLDWKVYGRTDKLYLKQYHKETNLRLMILVDVSGSMGYSSRPSGEWSKYDLAATVAASLAYLAIQQQDRVRLALFASAMVAETSLSNAHDHWRSIVDVLSSMDRFDDAPQWEPARRATDLARVFDQVTARLTHRSLVILLSDLFDDPEALERGFAQLHHRGHDLIVFQALDHAEVVFPFRSPSRFMGLEDDGHINLDPIALRRSYLDAFEAHRARLDEIARRFHFDYLLLDSSKSLHAPLSHFLARRSVMIAKAK